MFYIVTLLSLFFIGKFLLLLCSYVLQYSRKQNNTDETGESNDSRGKRDNLFSLLNIE